MKMKISDKEKQSISQMIAKAEKKSHSEIVPMIVEFSDDYPAAHFRGALLLSFLFSLALYLSPLSIINPIYFLLIQIPGLICGHLFANIPFFARILVTKEEMKRETHQRALEAFYYHNVHKTQSRTGVLIFISLFERRIEIIGDLKISEKIDQKIWNEIILGFSTEVKSTPLTLAFEHLIDQVSNVLENHFPKHDQASSKNEIKNTLIIE